MTQKLSPNFLGIPLTQAGIRMVQANPDHPQVCWWFSRLSETLKEQALREIDSLPRPVVDAAPGGWVLVRVVPPVQ